MTKCRNLLTATAVALSVLVLLLETTESRYIESAYNGVPFPVGSSGLYGAPQHYQSQVFSPPATFYDKRKGILRSFPGGGIPILVDYFKRCSGNYVGIKAHPEQSQYYYVCKPDCVVFGKCQNLQTFDRKGNQCIPYSTLDFVPTCKKEGRFPIHTDCKIYFKCEADMMPHIFSCPASMIFSPALTKCIPGNRCAPTQIAADGNHIPDNCENKFPPCVQDGVFRSPSDCSLYYNCTLQKSQVYLQTRFKCPAETFYDEQKGKCLLQHEVPCDCIQVAELVYPKIPETPLLPCLYPPYYSSDSLEDNEYPTEDSRACDEDPSVEQWNSKSDESLEELLVPSIASVEQTNAHAERKGTVTPRSITPEQPQASTAPTIAPRMLIHQTESSPVNTGGKIPDATQNPISVIQVVPSQRPANPSLESGSSTPSPPSPAPINIFQANLPILSTPSPTSSPLPSSSPSPLASSSPAPLSTAPSSAATTTSAPSLITQLSSTPSPAHPEGLSLTKLQSTMPPPQLKTDLQEELEDDEDNEISAVKSSAVDILDDDEDVPQPVGLETVASATEGSLLAQPISTDESTIVQGETEAPSPIESEAPSPIQSEELSEEQPEAEPVLLKAGPVDSVTEQALVQPVTDDDPSTLQMETEHDTTHGHPAQPTSATQSTLDTNTETTENPTSEMFTPLREEILSNHVDDDANLPNPVGFSVRTEPSDIDSSSVANGESLVATTDSSLATRQPKSSHDDDESLAVEDYESGFAGNEIGKLNEPKLKEDAFDTETEEDTEEGSQVKSNSIDFDDDIESEKSTASPISVRTNTQESSTELAHISISTLAPTANSLSTSAPTANSLSTLAPTSNSLSTSTPSQDRSSTDSLQGVGAISESFINAETTSGLATSEFSSIGTSTSPSLESSSELSAAITTTNPSSPLFDVTSPVTVGIESVTGSNFASPTALPIGHSLIKEAEATETIPATTSGPEIEATSNIFINPVAGETTTGLPLAEVEFTTQSVSPSSSPSTRVEPAERSPRRSTVSLQESTEGPLAETTSRSSISEIGGTTQTPESSTPILRSEPSATASIFTTGSTTSSPILFADTTISAQPSTDSSNVASTTPLIEPRTNEESTLSPTQSASTIIPRGTTEIILQSSTSRVPTTEISQRSSSEVPTLHLSSTQRIFQSSSSEAPIFGQSTATPISIGEFINQDTTTSIFGTSTIAPIPSGSQPGSTPNSIASSTPPTVISATSTLASEVPTLRSVSHIEEATNPTEPPMNSESTTSFSSFGEHFASTHIPASTFEISTTSSINHGLSTESPISRISTTNQSPSESISFAPVLLSSTQQSAISSSTESVVASSTNGIVFGTSTPTLRASSTHQPAFATRLPSSSTAFSSSTESLRSSSSRQVLFASSTETPGTSSTHQSVFASTLGASSTQQPAFESSTETIRHPSAHQSTFATSTETIRHPSAHQSIFATSTESTGTSSTPQSVFAFTLEASSTQQPAFESSTETIRHSPAHQPLLATSTQSTRSPSTHQSVFASSTESVGTASTHTPIHRSSTDASTEGVRAETTGAPHTSTQHSSAGHFGVTPSTTASLETSSSSSSTRSSIPVSTASPETVSRLARTQDLTTERTRTTPPQTVAHSLDETEEESEEQSVVKSDSIDFGEDSDEDDELAEDEEPQQQQPETHLSIDKLNSSTPKDVDLSTGKRFAIESATTATQPEITTPAPLDTTAATTAASTLTATTSNTLLKFRNKTIEIESDTIQAPTLTPQQQLQQQNPVIISNPSTVAATKGSVPRLELLVQGDLDLQITYCPADCSAKHNHKFAPAPKDSNRVVQMRWLPRATNKTLSLETAP